MLDVEVYKIELEFSGGIDFSLVGHMVAKVLDRYNADIHTRDEIRKELKVLEEEEISDCKIVIEVVNDPLDEYFNSVPDDR